ncbi:ADP-ribosylglycohydrolase family protein [Vibrio viridaestus]|uniref:ADP-ribosylglycohydrolase family protein n=1 Tax=Vibrio viridaestus TaxID=2487322 RepID=UPI001AA05CC1|nr:ADP-ribosylglycohydrolase family protein [Vibrio viridaestus]
MGTHAEQFDIKGLQDRTRGALIGLAVGDAVGTTLEFLPRGSFEPINDMVGGGHFALKKGYWTDDTSMALCLGYSLIEAGGFDPSDQMTRYCDWMDYGYLSSTGTCFDIGITVSSALGRFKKNGNPLSGSKARWSSGNGSIMRLAPIPMYYQHSMEEAVLYAAESSRTTHGSDLCLDACKLMSSIIVEMINSGRKVYPSDCKFIPQTDEIMLLRQGMFLEKQIDQIKGSGYVVESLEAAMWCFYNTSTFEECVLRAANLGDDADTTAAIAGQLAGSYYGVSGIKKSWLESLHKYESIQLLADRIFDVSYKRRLSSY